MDARHEEPAVHDAAWHRAVFDQAPVGLFQTDADGNCTGANDYVCRLTGLSEHELLGTGWLRAIHPDDRVAVLAHWTDVARGRAETGFEFRTLNASGGIAWVAALSSEVVPNGERRGFVGTLVDITERHERERSAARVEETLRRAFDAAPLGMGIVRVDGTFVQVNQRLCDQLGASWDDVLGARYQDFSLPDELEAEAPLLQLLLAGEIDTYEVPKRYTRPDGEVRHGLMRVTAVRRADGEIEHVLGIVEDVTLRVVAEQERRRAEEQLQSVLELSPVGIILADGPRALLANPAEHEITGRDVTSLDDMRGVLHPDDVEEFEANVVRAIEHGERFSGQVRLVRPDGEERWVLVTAGFAHDGSERVVVMTQDITAQIEHENELARYGELFAALTDFVAMTDEHGRLLYLNRVGEIYSPRDACFTELASFFDADSQRVLAEQAWPEVLDGGLWSGEMTITPVPQLAIPVSLVLVRCATQAGSFVAAVARDVTDLKEAQRRLEEQATHDQLTGLPNRRLLDDRLDNALARSERSDHEIALLFVDLDGFKVVNDTHGHDVGDDVLVSVAHRLRGLVRDGDTVARLGGDEFVVILDPVGSRADALRVAGRIVTALGEPFRVPRGEMRLGASVGVAFADDVANHGDVLMKAADLAVYAAKRLGKHCSVTYDPRVHGQITAA